MSLIVMGSSVIKIATWNRVVGVSGTAQSPGRSADCADHAGFKGANRDQLVKSHDLRGPKVRIIILDQAQTDNPWLRSLHAWADSHRPVGHWADDSREGVYPGTADDPR
jgi:hypothetical protein